METKHTPGPWLYNDTTAQVHPPHSATIAEVCNHDLNREANARLIAAAPELLEACVAMAEWVDAHGEIVFVGGGRGVVNPMNNARLLSRAAIAKATGNDG